MADAYADLVYSLVDSVVSSFLYVLGRHKILPEDRFYGYYLRIGSKHVLYLSLVLARRYVVRVL